MTIANDLQRGREAFGRRAWREACDALTRADARRPLASEDRERLAIAAYLIGREGEFHAHLERAHETRLQTGEPTHAARCAFWLGLTSLFRGESARGSGWLARARREIEGVDCVEHGYLRLPTAEQQLGQGDPVAAHASAAEAVALGERFDDDDLVACARHVQGRALVAQGRVEAGLALLDDAMLSVVTGALHPIVTGLVYCSVIAACHEVYAVRRADEWTSALAHWCEQQPEMLAFSGTCLVHRAEVLQLRGAWADAMAEACRACDRARQDVATPMGAGLYRQGELHRLRGELAAAEACFREAARVGAEVQPGLALLRMAEGRHDAACAALRRALASVVEPLCRAAMLPAYVDVLVAANALDDAQGAAQELDAIARTFDTEALHALALHAGGAVALGRGEAADALGMLRRAFERWQALDAPYEAARVRVLIGMACRSLGDEEAAALEFDAAGAAFERLGAAPDHARLKRLRGGTSAPATANRLTPREAQVLRLIAGGNTNKAIAARLHLSERTIDRHVSNMLTKLDVPSRAAAIAYAYEHRLL